MDNNSNIAKRWRVLNGEDNWKGLLDPFDIDLRRHIIHYGEMTQATYDNFISDKLSKYAGSSQYAKTNVFAKLGPDPLMCRVTKYLYATSSTHVPNAFILKSLSRETWNKESNWMGYVAVATDEGKAKLGRRDIRHCDCTEGTIQALEWANNLQILLVSPSKIIGEQDDDTKVHQGFYSIYTSNDPRSPFTETSARDQVLVEIRRLVEEYQNEEISITVVGHSLGAAIATLNAFDIAANGFNIPRNQPDNACPVTAFVFASPRVGDSDFKKVSSGLKNLHILRIRNALDIVPKVPFIGYKNVGEKLAINTTKSEYLKHPGNLQSWHNLEAYLHGVAETGRTWHATWLPLCLQAQELGIRTSKGHIELKYLHILRIRNALDIVPKVPFIGYKNVGEKLAINTTKLEYLKHPGNLQSWHNLEAYLHGVAGTKGGFKLEVDREVALVNKSLDALKDEYLIPASW
ncbi:Phospholipase A1-IIgamma [Camellia lanceoleosa]|uniref:Phospholipase A1-IIgamma n=1 Tax=Camellia lanceoleosa TaxID=1840588 RepID=A0ACC0GL71_9ERIC|nr:Phospholipase A1-IIgamma [Camellia lanceoleosa]